MTALKALQNSSVALMPAMPPPNGEFSNFTNPNTNSSSIRILNGLFLGIAVLSLLVRLSIRTSLPIGQKLGWDDAFCTLAVIASLAHTVLIFLVLDRGYGRHLWDIQAISITHGKLIMIAFVDMVYVIAIFLVKVSILLLYHRLFAIYPISRRLILIGYFFVTFVMICTLANSIARVTTCTNIQKAMVTPFCSGENVNIVLIVVAVLNSIADFYILAIPIHRVATMHISLPKKFGVLVIFLNGLIACAMSLVRLVVITQNLHSPDVLWNGSRVTPFTIVEMNLGIICGCMMFVPAFLNKGKMTLHSMKSSLLSRTGASLSKVGSVESHARTNEQKPSIRSVDNKSTTWEEQLPDLELLTENTAPSQYKP